MAATNIEDLEEIPREEWPDLSQLDLQPFNGVEESPAPHYQLGNNMEEWSPFVVNG